MERNAQKIIKTAYGWLGVEEVPRGSNAGKLLEHILRKTPFKPGEKWCFYFCLAVLQDALEKDGGLPFAVLSTGSCQLAAEHALNFGCLSPYPATGCIFVLHDEAGHYHHSGIVVDVDKTEKFVTTVEGNTNVDGSTNGYGVFKRVRSVANLKFIIW